MARICVVFDRPRKDLNPLHDFRGSTPSAVIRQQGQRVIKPWVNYPINRQLPLAPAPRRIWQWVEVSARNLGLCFGLVRDP